MQTPPQTHDAQDALGPIALERVQALVISVGRVLELSLALARAGRLVDLTGIDLLAGRMCAQALDLPASLGSTLAPALHAQLALLDALARHHPAHH